MTFKWLFRHVEKSALMDRIDQQTKEIARLRSQQMAFELEMRDFLLSKIEPLSKRLQTRMTQLKEKEEAAQEEKENINKPGLLSPSEYYATKKRSV